MRVLSGFVEGIDGLAWPLVGRDDVLASCRVSVESGRGVVIAGPAGVGKTRLAREIADGLDDDPARKEPVVRIAAVGAMSIPLSSLVPQQRPADVATPAIVVIDDVQQLDDDAAVLLHSLVTQRTIVLIATLRTGEAVPTAVSALWKDDHVDRADLSDLTRDQVDEVLDLALAGPISAPARLRFWESTLGSPLTLRELVRSSLDDRSLVVEGGLWQLVREPRSVRLDELVGARLEALDPAARQVVELVAIGEPLGFAQLVGDVGVDALAGAEQSGLVEAVTDGLRRDVRLAHPLFGDVARRQLGEARTAQLSGQLLAQLESTPMRRQDDIVRAVALQLRAGGTVVSADMVLAARRAMYDNKVQLAVELATRALTSDAVEAALIIGSSLVNLGDPERAESILSGVGGDATQDVSDADRSMVVSERVRAMFWGLGNAEAANELLLSTEAELPPGPWRDHITAGRALMASNTGRVAEALELARPFIEGAPEGRAFVTASIAGSCSLLLSGRSDDAIALAQRAFDACVALDGQLAVTDPGIFIVTQAMAMSESGQLLQAEELSNLAYEVTVAEGQRVGQAWFSMVSARGAMVRGHLGRACELFTEAAATFATLHHDGPRRWSLAGLVICSAMRGANADAERAWVELESVPEHPAMMMGTEVQRAAGWIQVSRGDRAAGIVALRRAVEVAVDDGATVLAGGVLHDLVRLGADVDDAAWDQLAECQGPLAPLRARFGRAVDGGRAADLAEVAEGFAEIGADMFAAEAWSIAADLASATGSTRSATQYRRAAGEAQNRTGDEWFVTLDRPGAAVDAVAVLTGRELEVAQQAAAGRTNRAIADALDVSIRTVENHLQRAYDKLGVGGRKDLAVALPPA